MRLSPKLLGVAGIALAIGAIAGTSLSQAQAQDAPPALPTLTPPPPAELMCKTFRVTPDDEYGGIFTTSDPNDPIGQWASEQSKEGWRPFSADFEIGVKGTGFPVSYTQVCLARPEE
ncbi:MAG: hypothetical protein VX899_12625 [Myxococcota bacterium]|nr:hypothetical protein [Myxococcota bacterium]